ncbi:uncharacterized protein [Clytia hemisphaerica]|uniref:uncharacterized protein n=1 Tax=Clytia hemisphaerica TaxID=252671 RepID=UPI0034D49A75
MVRRMFQSNRSVLNVAPTGAAAVLLPDGSTIHSAVHIPRNTGSNTATLVDKPMSAGKYKELKDLTLDENEHLSLMCINADERGMVGEYVLAWFHHRFMELSIHVLKREGVIPFGCTPAFNFFGDIFQLGAISSSNLGDPIVDSTTPIEAAGNLVYSNFQDVIVLEEIMRQKPDQMALLKRLDNLRTGNVTRKDWEEINARSLNSLCEEEKRNFDSEVSNVICLTETWKEARMYNKNALNSKYVNGNRAVSAEIISTGVGIHHSKEKEPMGQIPNVSIVAAGCRVILTKNQEIGMEAKNYGTAYTTFSRVTEDADWCIAEPIPFERLEYLNRQPKRKVRQAEEKRLKSLSEKTIRENPCSIEQYLLLIQEIDAFCDDGIQDSRCYKNAVQCRCVLHSFYQ